MLRRIAIVSILVLVLTAVFAPLAWGSITTQIIQDAAECSFRFPDLPSRRFVAICWRYAFSSSRRDGQKRSLSLWQR